LVIFLAILAGMFAQGFRLFREAGQSGDSLLKALGIGFVGCVVGAAVANFFGDRWSYLQVDSYLWISLALVCRGCLLAEPVAAEVKEVQVKAPTFSSAPFQWAAN